MPKARCKSTATAPTANPPSFSSAKRIELLSLPSKPNPTKLSNMNIRLISTTRLRRLHIRKPYSPRVCREVEQRLFETHEGRGLKRGDGTWYNLCIHEPRGFVRI